MPTIIDYPRVLEQMQQLGLRSLYFNSGAFGFPANLATHSIGWIAEDDATMTAAAREIAQIVSHPQDLLIRAWRDFFPGPLWLMPASHWAYELDFGNREWLAPALAKIGVDSKSLQPRTDAAAVEFTFDESESAKSLILQCLQMLRNSDFYIVFPNHHATCLLHHHAQLWWTSDDASLIAKLKALV